MIQRRYCLMLLTILTTLLLASVSYSATVQIPRTGQTKCYGAETEMSCSGSGQDGELQTGAPWPVARFTDNSIANPGNLSVTDNLTGLTWAKDGKTAPDTLTWQQALDFITGLNVNNHLGYSDWRLPNRNEMESLIDKSQSDQALWLNTQGFTNIQRDYYWTSSTDVDSLYCSSATCAWYVYMGSGGMTSGFTNRNYKTTKHYFLPVRGGQGGAVSLPRTGQSGCYNELGTPRACSETGEDGDTLAGIVWPIPRFHDNSDQTITDKLTGLVWSKNTSPASSDGSGETKTWIQSLDYVKTLNSNKYLGYNDWRLPNINELASLSNKDFTDQRLWLQNQGFINLLSGSYWSSTTSATHTDTAWMFWIDYSFTHYQGKNWTFYVWPVRGSTVVSTKRLTVVKDGNGEGNIIADSGSLNWNGNSGTADYDSGTIVNLSAVPSSGSVFNGWGGACGGNFLCGITMTDNMLVTVTFKKADRAKIVGGSGYATIADAYAAAVNGNTLLMLDGDHVVNTLNLNKTITLKGGYNTSFTALSGVPTVLDGIINIIGETVTMDRIIIK